MDVLAHTQEFATLTAVDGLPEIRTTASEYYLHQAQFRVISIKCAAGNSYINDDVIRIGRVRFAKQS